MEQAHWDLLYEPKAFVSFVATIDLATSLYISRADYRCHVSTLTRGR